MAGSNEIKGNLNMFAVAPGVWGLKDIFVNIYMVRNGSTEDWVLVDAGLKTSASKIKSMAAQIFGSHSRPSCIILTHGHFDHVGSLIKLAKEWNVTVYAHYLEKPYLTGASSYPPADPSVGGGLMASLSFLYPKGPINIEDRLQLLPADGSVPGLAEWNYIHTPGHTPGHISLFREKDKVLISGDAFVTLKAESLLAIMSQHKKISGPPKYLTPDWISAEESVKKLAALEPDIVASGHGQPMNGDEMRNSLNKLSWHFAEEAVPKHGRYVDVPAIADANGVQYIPPRQQKVPSLVTIAVVTATVTLACILLARRRKKRASSYDDLFKSELEFE